MTFRGPSKGKATGYSDFYRGASKTPTPAVGEPRSNITRQTPTNSAPRKSIPEDEATEIARRKAMQRRLSRGSSKNPISKKTPVTKRTAAPRYM